MSAGAREHGLACLLEPGKWRIGIGQLVPASIAADNARTRLFVNRVR